MIRILLCFLIISFAACTKTPNIASGTYFGGQIVNPTGKYVVLLRNDAVIDSARIDANNRFSFQMDSLNEGLYHFSHHPELQYVYLEEGDSVLLRLNTLEFDESLVFSGTGSEINNFLIDSFLSNEEQEKEFSSFYKLEPDEFSHVVDSIRQLGISSLEEFIKDNTPSENVIALARATIDYRIYTHKEKYPFFHRMHTREKSIKDMNSDFYAYRKNLDFNDKNLTYFRPYYDFMKFHFANMTYATCKKNCGLEHAVVKNALHFNTHKLKLVDSIVREKELRNVLFRNIAMEYLLMEHNAHPKNERFVNQFTQFSNNNAHISEIKNLYQYIQNLQPQRELPNLACFNTAGQKVNLNQIAEKGKTVFYFWSSSQKGHFKNTIRKVSGLEKSYPNINFIGINLRTERDQWLAMVRENSLDANKQYHWEDSEQIQRLLVIDGLNKCIITEGTEIVDAFANLQNLEQNLSVAGR